MRIVFTGGGTGGHLYPIIAVAREVRKIAEEERILDLELFYLGPDAIPGELARAEELTTRRIPAGKLRAYRSIKNLLDLFVTALGAASALWNMFLIMPDVIFVKGGYGSFPALVAAWLYRIPIVVHESDAVPGRVNRWAGRRARRVAISFAAAAASFPSDRTALTGVPIRSRLLGASKEQAREVFGVFSERPVLFFTGASQGAVALNRAVIESLSELLTKYEVIHQVGALNYEDVKLETAPLLEEGRDVYYHAAGFFSEEQMRSAFALADLVVARASATTIFEIAATAKPSILVPLPQAAQDHQRQNAYAYSRSGAAIVIEQENLTPSLLRHEIETLIADPALRAKMASAAKSFAKPDAATVVARELLTVGLH